MNFKSKATGIFAAAVISVSMAGGAMAQAVGTEADLSVNVENVDEVVGTFTFGFTTGAFDLVDVEISDEEGAIADGSAELFVEDTREDHGEWDINMSSTHFHLDRGEPPVFAPQYDIHNSNLGVTPGSTGDATTLIPGGSSNLGDPSLMVRGLPAFQGEATQSSELSLLVPAGTESGTYSATLSLTATGDIDGDNGDDD